MHKVASSNGKQKVFPVLGIRVPAPEAHDFDKRSRTICIRCDPSLYEALHDLANHVYMKVSTYAMRVLWSHAAEQQLLGNRGNHCQRGTV